MIGFARAKHFPSQNHGVRRGVTAPDLIILHYTAMPDARAALERLCSQEHDVSAHYLIACDGLVFQLVSEEKRAWHAGKSFWRGDVDINSRSIGIELDNSGNHPFSVPQMQSLIRLCRDIQERWSIVPQAVLGHSDVSIGRKTDPGRRFDWQGLARFGIGVWPEKLSSLSQVSEEVFLQAASRIGYNASLGLSRVLGAVRLHFAPSMNGLLTAADCALITSLEKAFVIDPSVKKA